MVFTLWSVEGFRGLRLWTAPARDGLYGGQLVRWGGGAEWVFVVACDRTAAQVEAGRGRQLGRENGGGGRLACSRAPAA